MELTRFPLAVKKPEQHSDGTDISMLNKKTTSQPVNIDVVYYLAPLAPRLTGAGDHGDGALALRAAAFGLNELGAAEEGVSPLTLRAVGLVGGGKRRL